VTRAITIRPIGAAEAEARVSELADILVDAVSAGAAINFMAGFSDADGRAFWRAQLAGIAGGERLLFVGDDGDRLLATAMLAFAQQPNAPHRAEVFKMVVHSSVRRQGLGRRLLETVEAAARKAGRTLLVLDTETGSAGEALYRSCGWTEYGRLAGHSRKPDGQPTSATYFYKKLA
jgi:GNAT superfamily N-acetyltransferase